ncbi:MAG: hypothetical protein DRP71_06670 [Verrucomicrobia bacterium]|nr:MAG: hypothetical protein DRP71_06670 [Verrucomicrobiota bacterium]
MAPPSPGFNATSSWARLSGGGFVSSSGLSSCSFSSSGGGGSAGGGGGGCMETSAVVTESPPGLNASSNWVNGRARKRIAVATNAPAIVTDIRVLWLAVL